MAKDKVTVTVDPGVLVEADRDAAALGLNRSEYVETVLRDAHYARLLAGATPDPEPTPADEAALRDLLRWQAAA